MRELASAFLSRPVFFRQWTVESLSAWNICVYHEHGSDDGVHEVEVDNKIYAGMSTDGDRGSKGTQLIPLSHLWMGGLLAEQEQK